MGRLSGERAFVACQVGLMTSRSRCSLARPVGEDDSLVFFWREVEHIPVIRAALIRSYLCSANS